MGMKTYNISLFCQRVIPYTRHMTAPDGEVSRGPELSRAPTETQKADERTLTSCQVERATRTEGNAGKIVSYDTLRTNILDRADPDQRKQQEERIEKLRPLLERVHGVFASDTTERGKEAEALAFDVFADEILDALEEVSENGFSNTKEVSDFLGELANPIRRALNRKSFEEKDSAWINYHVGFLYEKSDDPDFKRFVSVSRGTGAMYGHNLETDNVVRLNVDDTTAFAEELEEPLRSRWTMSERATICAREPATKDALRAAQKHLQEQDDYTNDLPTNFLGEQYDGSTPVEAAHTPAQVYSTVVKPGMEFVFTSNGLYQVRNQDLRNEGFPRTSAQTVDHLFTAAQERNNGQAIEGSALVIRIKDAKTESTEKKEKLPTLTVTMSGETIQGEEPPQTTHLADQEKRTAAVVQGGTVTEADFATETEGQAADRVRLAFTRARERDNDISAFTAVEIEKQTLIYLQTGESVLYKLTEQGLEQVETEETADVQTIPITPGERYLVTTHSAIREITEQDVQRILRESPDANEAIQKLTNEYRNPEDISFGDDQEVPAPRHSASFVVIDIGEAQATTKSTETSSAPEVLLEARNLLEEALRNAGTPPSIEAIGAITHAMKVQGINVDTIPGLRDSVEQMKQAQLHDVHFALIEVGKGRDQAEQTAARWGQINYATGLAFIGETEQAKQALSQIDGNVLSHGEKDYCQTVLAQIWQTEGSIPDNLQGLYRKSAFTHALVRLHREDAAIRITATEEDVYTTVSNFNRINHETTDPAHLVTLLRNSFPNDERRSACLVSLLTVHFEELTPDQQKEAVSLALDGYNGYRITDFAPYVTRLADSELSQKFDTVLQNIIDENIPQHSTRHWTQTDARILKGEYTEALASMSAIEKTTRLPRIAAEQLRNGHNIDDEILPTDDQAKLFWESTATELAKYGAFDKVRTLPYFQDYPLPFAIINEAAKQGDIDFVDDYLMQNNDTINPERERAKIIQSLIKESVYNNDFTFAIDAIEYVYPETEEMALNGEEKAVSQAYIAEKIPKRRQTVEATVDAPTPPKPDASAEKATGQEQEGTPRELIAQAVGLVRDNLSLHSLASIIRAMDTIGVQTEDVPGLQEAVENMPHGSEDTPRQHAIYAVCLAQIGQTDRAESIFATLDRDDAIIAQSYGEFQAARIAQADRLPSPDDLRSRSDDELRGIFMGLAERGKDDLAYEFAATMRVADPYEPGSFSSLTWYTHNQDALLHRVLAKPTGMPFPFEGLFEGLSPENQKQALMISLRSNILSQSTAVYVQQLNDPEVTENFTRAVREVASRYDEGNYSTTWEGSNAVAIALALEGRYTAALTVHSSTDMYAYVEMLSQIENRTLPSHFNHNLSDENLVAEKLAKYGRFDLLPSLPTTPLEPVPDDMPEERKREITQDRRRNADMYTQIATAAAKQGNEEYVEELLQAYEEGYIEMNVDEVWKAFAKKLVQPGITSEFDPVVVAKEIGNKNIQAETLAYIAEIEGRTQAPEQEQQNILPTRLEIEISGVRPIDLIDEAAADLPRLADENALQLLLIAMRKHAPGKVLPSVKEAVMRTQPSTPPALAAVGEIEAAKALLPIYPTDYKGEQAIKEVAAQIAIQEGEREAKYFLSKYLSPDSNSIEKGWVDLTDNLIRAGDSTLAKQIIDGNQGERIIFGASDFSDPLEALDFIRNEPDAYSKQEFLWELYQQQSLPHEVQHQLLTELISIKRSDVSDLAPYVRRSGDIALQELYSEKVAETLARYKSIGTTPNAVAKLTAINGDTESAVREFTPRRYGSGVWNFHDVETAAVIASERLLNGEAIENIPRKLFPQTDVLEAEFWVRASKRIALSGNITLAKDILLNKVGEQTLAPRARYLTNLGVIAADQGKLKEAREIMENDATEKDKVLFAIAYYQLKEGQGAQALETTRTITDPGIKVEALAHIAEFMKTAQPDGGPPPASVEDSQEREKYQGLRAAGASEAKIDGLNQDNYFFDPNGIGVFDGFTPTERGGQSSSLSAQTYLQSIPDQPSIAHLVQAIQNRLRETDNRIAVNNTKSDYDPGVGSTALVCYIYEEEQGDRTAVIGGVGSDRAYKIMADGSVLSVFESQHPHELLGVSPDTQKHREVRTTPFNKGESIILLTKGIHEHVSVDVLNATLARTDLTPQEKLEALIQEAGDEDDRTGTIIYHETPTVSTPDADERPGAAWFANEPPAAQPVSATPALVAPVPAKRTLPETVNAEVATPVETEAPWRRAARERQQQIYQEFGIDVPPIPESLTQEAYEALEAQRMQLVYIPPIDFGNRRQLDGQNITNLRAFMTHLRESNPVLEKLAPTLMNDEIFWKALGRGSNKADTFPSLQPGWKAIETIPQPQMRGNTDHPEPYETTDLPALLDVDSHRIGVRGMKLARSLQYPQTQDNLRARLHLPPEATVRLPSLYEWWITAGLGNLQTVPSIAEWTSTQGVNNLEYVILAGTNKRSSTGYNTYQSGRETTLTHPNNRGGFRLIIDIPETPPQKPVPEEPAKGAGAALPTRNRDTGPAEKFDAGGPTPPPPESVRSEAEARNERVAEALAQETRARGMGYVDGTLPQQFEPKPGAGGQTIGGFDQGSERSYNHPEGLPINSPFLTSETKGRYWTAAPLGFHQRENIQLPAYRRETPGREDWVQYSYYKPVRYHATGNRPGNCAILVVGVPPDISQQIDAAMQQDPRFADTYFKAMYPELFAALEEKPEGKQAIYLRDLRVDTNPEHATKVSLMESSTPAPRLPRRETTPAISAHPEQGEKLSRGDALRRNEATRLGVETVPELPRELTAEVLASLEKEYDVHYIPQLTDLQQIRDQEQVFEAWMKAHRSIEGLKGGSHFNYARDVRNGDIELHSLEGGRWVARKKAPKERMSVAENEKRQMEIAKGELERLHLASPTLRLPTPYELWTLPHQEGTIATGTRLHDSSERDTIFSLQFMGTRSNTGRLSVTSPTLSYDLLVFPPAERQDITRSEPLPDRAIEALPRYKKRLGEVNDLMTDDEFVTDKLYRFILTHLDAPADRIVRMWRADASLTGPIGMTANDLLGDYKNTFLTAKPSWETIQVAKKRTAVESQLADDEYLAPELLQLIETNPRWPADDILTTWKESLQGRTTKLVGKQKRRVMQIAAYQHNIALLQEIFGRGRRQHPIFVTNQQIEKGIDAGQTPEQVLESARTGRTE